MQPAGLLVLLAVRLEGCADASAGAAGEVGPQQVGVKDTAGAQPQ